MCKLQSLCVFICVYDMLERMVLCIFVCVHTSMRVCVCVCVCVSVCACVCVDVELVYPVSF